MRPTWPSCRRPGASAQPPPHIPWRFTVSPEVLDSGAIAPKDWRGREVARLTAPMPEDGYVGLAVVPRAGNRLTIWLIADDNDAVLIACTPLPKLAWRSRASASVK